MSQILTAPSALWKQGRNNNIEFLSSFKRLEKEQPEIYKLIEQKEGYICQDHEYEYRVGQNKFGLWLSRRKLGLEGLRQLEDKPSPRPVGFTNVQPTNELEELKKRVSKLEHVIECMVNAYHST